MTTINDNPTVVNTKTELRIPLDAMHNGIRMAVMGTFIGSGIAGFVVASLVMPNIIGLSLLVGVVTAAGSSLGVERALKHRWASGREFVADADRIAISKHDKIESVVDAQQHVNVLTWRFEIKKDSPRAKKSWYLLGLGLRQDENLVLVYTVIPPDEFDDMPLASSFVKLEKQKDKDDNANIGSTSGLRRAGEQRRLYDAEVVRQMIGGDMLKEDFIETLSFLQANYPRWMISE